MDVKFKDFPCPNRSIYANVSRMLMKVKFGGSDNSGYAGPKKYGRSYGNRGSSRAKAKATYRFEKNQGPEIKYGPVFSFGAVTFIKTTESVPAFPGTPIEHGCPVNVKSIDFKVTGVVLSRHSGSVIHVHFTVPCRTTGLPLQLTYNHAVLPNLEKNAMADQVRLAIAQAFDHEIREMLYLDQERFIDPHPETKQIKFGAAYRMPA